MNTRRSNRPTVSLIGLGPMGRPMAENLLAAYGPITVWNRPAHKAVDLAARGAAAEANELSLPTTNTVTQLFAQMVAEGHGELDHTGVYLTIRGAGHV